MQPGVVRTDSAKQLFRLAEECRELSAAGERRQHFLSELARLIHAQVATEAVCSRDAGGRYVRWRDPSDYGWDGADRSRVYEYVTSNPIDNDPLTWSALQRISVEPLVTTTRNEVMSQHDWERSEIRNDLHRPARLDESLVSVMRLPSPGEFHFIVLKRAWGDVAFAVEDREIVHLAHSAVAWVFEPPAGESTPSFATSFSPREKQTLELLLSGDSEKRIAARLGISGHTVHDYVKTIYRKVGVSSRAELMARAMGKLSPV